MPQDCICNCESIKELLTQRIDALEQRVIDWKEASEQARAAAKEASDTAEQRLREALVDYKENANEWQRTFREFKETTLSSMAPKGETDKEFDHIRGQIQRNYELITKLQGDFESNVSSTAGGRAAIDRRQTQSNWRAAFIVAVLSLIAGLIYFLTHLAKG